MKKIKNYQEFTNEEINWRKGLATAAIGASLMGGMTSCNKEDIRPNTEQTVQSDDLIGNWSTSFTIPESQYGESFSCKITFTKDGEYFITERKTASTSYPSLVRGTYKIEDDYEYMNGGSGKALILYDESHPGDFTYASAFKLQEIENGYRYRLIRQQNTTNLVELLGVQCPTIAGFVGFGSQTVTTNITVPDLDITKSF